MNKKNKFRIYTLAIIGMSLMLVNGCKEVEEPIETTANVPELITLAITDTTATTAKCGGTISNDGGAAITASGVCWSANPTPTIADSKTSDGATAGTFSSSMTGLTPNTLYYVRAYATNNVGTGYGNEVSFKSPKSLTKAPQEYTHKVLVEYTTCCHCSYCPDAELYMDKLIARFGANNVYGTAMHNTLQGPDKMTTAESQAFTLAWTLGNPSGTVNRITGKCESREKWEERASQVRDDDEKCGLSIDASIKTGDIYKVKVTVGIGRFDLPAGNYNVIAYLTKKESTGVGDGWDQTNGFNTTVGHPMYQKGNPLKNYIHPNVFVKPLNTMDGKPIDITAMKAGALSEYDIEIDMTGLNPSEYEITAFVYLNKPGAPFVENVQRVTVGQNKAFD